MANLGQLETFLDHDAITYTLDGKEESFTFPAKAVLRFHVELDKLKEDGQNTFSRLKIFELTAPIFGSTWNPEDANFTGGLLAKLLKNGQPFVVIDRMVSAVFVKLQFGDDELAEQMFRHGDLPKAIREQAAARREAAEAELEAMENTATNEGDSAEQTA